MVPPSSTNRSFGSIIVIFSNGFSLKPSSSCSYHGQTLLFSFILRKVSIFLINSYYDVCDSFFVVNGESETGFLSKKLSFFSYYSSGSWVSFCGLNNDTSKRNIWTSTPLCMGRRSCKIAGRKTAQDAKKSKLYARFGKEVVSAQLLAFALDAGADDVIEPSIDEDDIEEDSERYFKIVSSMDNYSVSLSKLREEEITFETDNGFELLPLTPIEVDDEAMDLNKELMSRLLELDDVDAVYTDEK